VTFPVRVLSFGAGVQSTTLLRMAIAEEIEPMQHAVFSDTGWEPPAVYRHLAVCRDEAERAGIEFHVVSNGNIREDALDVDHRFASMPLHVTNPDGSYGMVRRQCTSEYKLKPLLAKQRELAGLKPRGRTKEHRITSVIGISWDESRRMRDAAFPWIRNEYPLVDRRLTRADCLAWHDRRALAHPPRSACIGCPFHSNREWRAIRVDADAWADAVEFDRLIRHGSQRRGVEPMRGVQFLHRSRQPLADVDLRTEEERGQGSLWEGECEGMCGL